jgi:hypothetical protein
MAISMITQLTAAAFTAGALAVALSTAPASVASPIAHTTRVLRATDTAQLRYIPPAHGPVLYEEGTAHGTIPGTMRVHITLGGTVNATFTIYTSGGSVSGHGTATPHGSGIYESFGGTLVATSGTGRYLHAHGHAGLYGTFDRRTYALVVQTTGSLDY